MFDTTGRPQGQPDLLEKADDQFRAFIRDKSFPCVGAKSALARNQMDILEAGDIRCGRDDAAIFARLAGFAARFKAQPDMFQSFVVIFDTKEILSEDAFERALWSRIQALHDIDVDRGYSYDPRVGADVTKPDFSLSFGGEAFYMVGLHPGASRPARRFSSPAIVFNAHDQFEQLRADGRYETLRASIIDRDIALAGSANPMLSRFGDTSEATQYSGRHVAADWQCPFKL